MRILYVTAHYPPDFTSGATLQLRRIARHVAAAGHEVAVLSGAIARGLADGETRTETIDGVTVHWIGTADRIDDRDDRNWLNPAATAYAEAVLDRWRPDVVHAHVLQTLGAGPLAAAAHRGIATVLTMHDFWWWCARLFLVDQDLRPCPLVTTDSDCACARSAAWRRQRAERLRAELAAVDQVLAPSAVFRDVLVANGLAAARVEVDENDVDVDVEVDPAAVTPSQHTTATADVNFVYVGGDHPLKGRDVMVGAARRLRRRRGWRLTMYGTSRPARRWRWRRVRFERPYAPTETAAVLGAADVLVIPSIARESFSLAAREALAAGLAVITSDCLGPTEVVEDGVNGLIVPLADDAGLAGAMERLIGDRPLLARMRDAARAHPPELRRPAEHAASLIARYQRLLGRRDLRHGFSARPQQ